MRQNILKNKRLLMIVLFILLFFTSLRIGAVSNVTFINLLKGNKLAWTILMSSRLPRTLAIILAASGLSVAGLIMQSISRNKFMSPSTAGATNAAGLGIIIAFITLSTQSGIIQTIFAFCFSLVSTLLFTSVINRIHVRDVVYIPLIGMMYGGLISSITTLLAYQFDVMHMMQTINNGSFARVGSYGMIYIIAIPLILAVIYSSKFSIIGLGEDFSKNLGLNYNRVVFLGLVIIALVSAASFTAVGPLPFIGLIIPNMTASFYGDNIKKTIIDLMLFGINFVFVCDIISRLIIFPFEMSVSLTISIIGGVIFMFYVIANIKRKNKSQIQSNDKLISRKNDKEPQIAHD
ncbi:MAG: iron chelate uptake ABC transporter family permease subunit [Christensenellaceae bacterium]|jgi:iron complex transport system permease protein|nr:iron chelate uptake ABC transporter family permease subunit [Christensenellaceae bacterium]